MGEKEKNLPCKRITNNLSQYSALKGATWASSFKCGLHKENNMERVGKSNFSEKTDKDPPRRMSKGNIYACQSCWQQVPWYRVVSGPWPLWSFSPKPTVWVSPWKASEWSLSNWEGPLYQIFHQYPSKLSGSPKTRKVWESVIAKKSLRRHGS